MDSCHDIVVRCRCGWQGRQSELVKETCPRCCANFIAYPVAPGITRVSTMGERTVEQLLEELRMGRDLCTKEVGDIMWDAADEIERMRKENLKLARKVDEMGAMLSGAEDRDG